MSIGVLSNHRRQLADDLACVLLSSISKGDAAKIRKEQLSGIFGPAYLSSKDYNDWLLKHDLRMSEGRVFVTLTKRSP